MKTIAKISEESITLINYLESIANGQVLSYSQIQQETGVKMDNAGKSYLRTALNKLKREYSAIHGIGIELTCAKTATSVVVKRLVKIDRSVGRAEKTVKRVTTQFYNELSEPEQKQVNFLGAIFGAIKLSARNGKYYLKATNTAPAFPVLPENII